MKKLLSLTTTPEQTTMLVRGFTLVELMVAVVIGLIILGAVSQVFVTSRSTYSVEEGLSRIQENGRFGMNFIAEDVRMAGYIGCQDQTGDVSVQVNNAAQYQITGQIVTGHRYVGAGGTDPVNDWEPDLPAPMFPTAGEILVPFNDVVVVRRGSEQAFRVIAPFMGSEADDITIANSNGLSQYDLVMVADCKAADIFEITNADPDGTGTLQHAAGAQPQGPGNAVGQLSQLYGSNAEVLSLVTHAYYIARSPSPPNPAAVTDPPALFRKEINGGNFRSVELVDNIEALQFFFGVDSDNTGVANQYLTADAIGAGSPLWNTIASVRIGMVARSPDETGSDWDQAVYNVVGDTGSAVDDFDPTNVNGASDRRQRRVFTSTINVRNYTQYTK